MYRTHHDVLTLESRIGLEGARFAAVPDSAFMSGLGILSDF